MRRRNSIPSWIAVDWSAKGLRAWALDEAGGVLMKVRSAQGLAQIASDAVDTVLVNLVRPWLVRDRTPVIVAGLARQRREDRAAGVLNVPAALHDLSPRQLPELDPRMTVYALPGLMQTGPSAVLDGQQVIAQGVAAEHPGFDGVLCIPGDETHWLRVTGGEVHAIQSHMTGEIMARLSPLVGLPASGDLPAAAGPGFECGVNALLERPERLLQRLSALCADSHAQPGAPGVADRLAGYLVGADLAAAQEFWRDLPVLLIGSGPLADRYATGLAAQGASVSRDGADRLRLAGFRSALRRVQVAPA